MLKSLPLAMRSSMQKDVSAGFTPELDAIGGAIIRSAQRHRVDVPVIRKLVAEIQKRVRAAARSTRDGGI